MMNQSQSEYYDRTSGTIYSHKPRHTTMAKTETPDQQQLSTMDLAPSQTINSKRRKRGKPKAENSGEMQATESSQKESSTTAGAKPEAAAAAALALASTKPAAKKNRPQRKKNTKAPKEAPNNAQEKGSGGKPNGDEPGKKKQPAKSNNNNKAGVVRGGRNNSKRNNPRKRYPWRKHLPTDSVDPITLESLDSLTYPPFALVASAPHLPVPEWPIPEYDATEITSETAAVAAETEEDRQRRIINEQWGHKLTENETVIVEEKEQDEKTLAVPESKRYYHLYDGRALAYYMVSQLQFIDPLNRRDLTRDELVNLDRYLRRHNFDDINVTEAYDTKGVTLSSAGATANTAAGRVVILQQLAGNLLNGLFGRSSVSHQQQPSHQPSRPAAAAAAPASTNRLMMQYQAHEQNQQQSNRRRNNNTNTLQDGTNGAGTAFPEDLGIYGDAGGVLVIDDDLHPGLRSNAVEFVPGGADGAEGSNLFWSASHIAARYGHAAMAQQDNFPSLSAPAESSPSEASRLVRLVKPAPSNKTLSRITKTVRKTDPDEAQRQWEAREDSRRKAALSQLTFGSNQAAWGNSTMQEIPSSLPTTTTTTTTDAVPPTEAQLERNRAFAQALGVAPATVRTNINAGWARPTQATVELDEFGHELNATLYPDSLVMYARENMGPVLKLERKWKAFLSDDTASSLSMNHMDKPLRTKVHEYSDFWKLQTESFDPEPRRYIYCAKLRDTGAPYPLLSDAARNWRGPRTLLQNTISVLADNAFQQTAGQSARGRELPSGPDRVPLSLKARSQAADSEPTESLPGMAISGARTLTMTEPDAALNSRFGALSVGRERPMLELQKRTLPLELPAYEQPKGFDFSETVQRQRERVGAIARKEREAEERKQRALEAAFASSDEEGDGGRFRDDGSEWSEDEQVPLYTGEDEEEE
jgi:hypothetical protein